MKTNKWAVCAAALLIAAISFAACEIEAEDDERPKIERAEIRSNREISVIVSNDDNDSFLLGCNTVIEVNGRSSDYWFDGENVDLVWFEYDLFSGKTRKKHTGYLNQSLHNGDKITIRGRAKLLGSYTLHYYN
jgi:hypothetical protein